MTLDKASTVMDRMIKDRKHKLESVIKRTEKKLQEARQELAEILELKR